MCYSGNCKYEDHMGECDITSKLCTPNMPTDTYCLGYDQEIDRHQEDIEIIQDIIEDNDDLVF